jgi:OOP family OmpA-OmpF porin
MKKALVVLLVSCVLCRPALSQTTKDYTKPASLGLSFILNDFQTAQNIRSTSLSAVIRDKKVSKIKQMSPGLGVTYVKGLNNFLDATSTLSASFLDYPFDNGITSTSGKESLLLELDASLHAKLLPDNYIVNPYASLGLGISKYRGYYGALMPLGLGLQVNLFSESFLFINSQYRIKVSDNTNYHLYFSVGFTGTLGRSKEE